MMKYYYARQQCETVEVARAQHIYTLSILSNTDDYSVLCRPLINNKHCMGLDLVQTLMVEATCLTRAPALEILLFPILMTGIVLLLKIAGGKGGHLHLFAIVMVLLISLVSRTEDQGPQS